MMDTINQVMAFAQAHVNSSISNREDREDVLQECKVRFIKIIRSYRVKGPRFIAIAKKATRNAVRDFIRKKMIRSTLRVHNCMTERAVKIDAELVNLDVAARDFMNRLDEEEKILLEALFHGYTIEAISKLSGASKHKVRRISNGLKETAKNAVHIQ